MLAKLTTTTVKALRPKAKRYWVDDTELPGFRLSVASSGTKSFAVRLRTRGGRKLRADTTRVIGHFGPLTVAQARTEAKKLLSRGTLGENVASKLRETRTAPTIAELSATFLEHRHGKIKERTRHEYARLFNVEINPLLGTRAAKDLTRSDVAKLHSSNRKTPYLANRVVTLIASLYHWAESQELVPEHRNPAQKIELYPEKSRERYLTDAEMLRLGDAIRVAETVGFPPDPKRAALHAKRHKRPTGKVSRVTPANPTAIAMIRFAVLTGWRKGEVLALRWDTLDRESGRARLPETKTGLSWREIGLAASSILDTLPRLEDNPYVFPGSITGHHMTDVKHLWYAIRHQAGLGDVRLHDLRHNFASAGAQAGIPLLTLGAVLGHRETDTTKKYSHLGDSPVARAADQVAAGLAQRLGGNTARTEGAGRRATLKLM